MFEDILITGITPLEHYPEKCELRECKQNIKCMKFPIPCAKPDIESINEIKVSLCVQDYKIINTILGKKIVVNLAGKIKVIYTALNETQSVHSAHWDISFCDFILEKNNNKFSCHRENADVFVGVEEVYVHGFDNRTVELSIIYILCDSINKYFNQDEKKCKNESYGCNEKHTKYSPRKDVRNTYYYPVDYFVDSDKKM